METLVSVLSILIILAGIAIGLWFWRKPGQAIEMQQRFYAKINWKIEPISMVKELRNTKAMGLFLLLIDFLVLVYIVTRKIKCGV